ncbi:MAG: aminodeoxychorismate synthase component I [Gammaproteobacteria bacterium]|nr:aminodeoxychorismate synthase component I [Gammaproteobacteria bacterium]NND58742.1 aminodeoxychorismate synthase component I [Gammaproteobacteria bacterium]
MSRCPIPLGSEAQTAVSSSAPPTENISRSITRIEQRLDLRLLHARNPQRYPVLLESAASGTPQGRYDILLALPVSQLLLDSSGKLHGGDSGGSDFLSELDRQWQAERAPSIPGMPKPVPFISGWFLFLGYELAAQIEPRLNLQKPAGWPVAMAARMLGAIAYDHELECSFICAESNEVFEHLYTDVEQNTGALEPVPATLVQGVTEEDAERYIAAVAQAQQHIHRGDIYQANLSRSWRTQLLGPVSDIALYAALSESNPGSFAALARWEDQAVISSSPERLLCLRGDVMQTRPIAGTRPRGSNADEDAALVAELIEHPKERAEHIMLIDLERNDLGRVCQPGTVEVDEYMTLESYAHVHHIVSNVRGQMREDVSPVDAIRAVFPGGTITGCPKVRCMEIIAALEDHPRGAYTGSLGYLDLDGDCDLNILIRTLVRDGRSLTLRAGAGIVADSIAEREVEETRAKARGLLLALGETV